ncbi:MAG: BlaI/MecI/CopY family transcriptional regulator [Candidatus Alkaliphilus sp. MAG34]|nr:BlaI/MecI/CopY family transcriptional regulator [Clostridiales bacterium]
MPENSISLTPTEWNLMECLWESAPRTGREATEYLKKRVGWSRSTTLTLLRRMTEKGIIRCEEIDGLKAYSPLVKREDAVMRETKDFLSRVYKGSVSMMMSSITKKLELTREEIDELYGILRQAEEAEK